MCVIPAFNDETGALPLGRYKASVGDVKVQFVDAPRWSESQTRREVFEDWLQAKDMIDEVSPDLVECAWLSGSFVSTKLDPDDVDCLFVLRASAFDALSSNRMRARLLQFNRKGRIREKTGLRVEPFVMVRRVHVAPWSKDGSVIEEARSDLALRGAWDDWWLRLRSTDDKAAPPIADDAHPVRGYLEVHWP